MEKGFEEAAALLLGSGELRFQPITQGHQFIDLGDDAVLFGERREGDGKDLPLALADNRKRTHSRIFENESSTTPSSATSTRTC